MSWIDVKEKMPDDGARVDCKYDGVYELREDILFWIDHGGTGHFGGHIEIDGMGSQPVTHWKYA